MCFSDPVESRHIFWRRANAAAIMCLNMQQRDLLQLAQLTPPKALNSSGQSLVTTVCLISGVHEGQTGSPFSILAQTSAPIIGPLPIPKFKVHHFFSIWGSVELPFQPFECPGEFEPRRPHWYNDAWHNHPSVPPALFPGNSTACTIAYRALLPNHISLAVAV